METNKCKHYDEELGCCTISSDWSNSMPVLQPCVESPCDKYFPKYYEEHSYEDALKALKKQVRHWERGEPFAYHLQPLKTAVKALEKQIPIKPKITIKGTTDYNTKTLCPTCGAMARPCDKFCCKCGQAFDWGCEK